MYSADGSSGRQSQLVILDPGTTIRVAPPQPPPPPSPSNLVFRQIKPAVSRCGRDRASTVSPSVVKGMEELGLSQGRRYVLVSSAAAPLEGSPRVDNGSLQLKMGRNKRALEVKLQLRPPRGQLVDQGILPAAGTPPSFVEQRKRLERAQAGDALRAKMESRPDKAALVSARILLDGGGQEAGILEKTRQLKRTRLADSLNDKLAVRPGPLELVQDNILRVDGALHQAVREGRVAFKPTSAGLVDKHPEPVFLVQELGDGARLIAPHSFIPIAQSGLGQVSALSPEGSDGPHSKFKKPKSTQPEPAPLIAKQFSEPGPGQGSGKNKIIKFHEYKGPRSVGGWQGESPGCGDSESVASTPQPPPDAMDKREETSYDLLLQQQQLFLQWQLELQAKYPGHSIQLLPLPSSSSAPSLLLPGTAGLAPSNTALLLTPRQPPSPNSSTSVSSTSPYSATGEPSPATLPPPPPPNTLLPLPQQAVLPMGPPPEEGVVQEQEEAPAPAQRKPPHIIRPPLQRLEDLRVSELKAQCKKRGFPVSGPKPMLVERLRGVEEEAVREVREQIAGEGMDRSYPEQCNGSQECPESYPSPGLDLSQLTFQPPPHQPVQVSTSFTFAAQGSGGHFTALPPNQQQVPVGTQPQPGPDCSEEPQPMQAERAPTPAALLPAPPLQTPPQQMQQVQQIQQPPQQLATPQPPPMPPTQIQATPQRLDNLISPTLISSSTLSLHEEMLRHQQRKIEELQKELQRSQDQLKHQQALIVAARKAQAEESAGSKTSKSAEENVADAWLAHIDTKHLQRFHIQLFLHHKVQQQQMQAMLATSRQLNETHEDLTSSVRTESAAAEVRALLDADPTTAFSLLRSLRASPAPPPLNSNPCSNGEEPLHQASGQLIGSVDGVQAEPSSSSAAPPSRKMLEKRHSAPFEAPKDPATPAKAPVDMEEIFRTVLEAAKDETEKLDQQEMAPVEETPKTDEPLPMPVTTPASSSNGFVYTKNEAFDDLIEVLKSNEHTVSDNSNSGLSSSSQASGEVFPAPYPNTFGAQELAELLGPDWLDLPQPSVEGHAKEASPPTTCPPTSETDWFPSPASAAFPTPSFPEDMGGEEMEWLDQLVLPSPAAQPHPTHPSMLHQSPPTLKTSNPLLAQSAFAMS